MFDEFKKIPDCEDMNKYYIETPDGLRLVFLNDEYVGWYLP